jgi:hypothetical protein
MAAGPAKILYPDDLGMGPFQYQLLKSQSIAQTAITAAKLSQNLEDVSFDEDTVEFLEVQRYSAIRCQVWGVAADTNAPVINLYGWPASGPGQRLAVMTLAYGPFVSEDAANAAPGWHAGANAHLSIKKGFDRNIDYRGCDTYTMTTEFGAENIIETGPLYYQAYRPVISPRLLTDAIPIADFPSYFTVDFSRSNYAYFGVLVTTLAGTTLGAIFQPLAYRSRLSW